MIVSKYKSFKDSPIVKFFPKNGDDPFEAHVLGYWDCIDSSGSLSHALLVSGPETIVESDYEIKTWVGSKRKGGWHGNGFDVGSYEIIE